MSDKHSPLTLGQAASVLWPELEIQLIDRKTQRHVIIILSQMHDAINITEPFLF